MGRKTNSKVPPGLARARVRFEAWRRKQKPRARIPDRLWKLAAKLVAAHGLHRTSAALKLDYYSLKERVEEIASSQHSQRPAFLELAPPIAITKECILEFEGGFARVQLKGYDATDVAAVARSFRSAP